jgi:flagellar biosynthesis chaperone FliJ
MNNSCDIYKSQYKKAKETLYILESQKAEINSKLESNFLNANLHKDLRTINMDIRITENEIEHAESCIQECELKYNSSAN